MGFQPLIPSDFEEKRVNKLHVVYPKDEVILM